MNKQSKYQCKDIPELPILEFLFKNKGNFVGYDTVDLLDIKESMPKNLPTHKLILAKMDKLIKKGLVFGCACGCSGDFKISNLGESVLNK